MYQRIVVPLDGSKVAEGILPHVVRLAGAAGAEVVLLRVVEHPREGLRGSFIPSSGTHLSDRDLVKSSHKYLRQVQEGLETRGVRVRVDVITRIGVAEAIVEWAVEHEMDAIALMSHGLGPAARGVFGSVAGRLLELSPLPLLIVRATSEVLEQQQEQEEDALDEAVFACMRVER